jgi:hypothetical protein
MRSIGRRGEGVYGGVGNGVGEHYVGVQGPKSLLGGVMSWQA